MRRFSLGEAVDRKVVVVEVKGTTLAVVRMKPDGSSAKQEQTLPSEAAARAAADKVAAELLGRGYVEHGRSSAAPVAKTRSLAHTSAVTSPAAPPTTPSLFDDLEPVEASASPLARLAPPPASDEGPARAKKPHAKKKKKKGPRNPDALDRRVLAAVTAVVLALVGGVGYMAYDLLLKPASIFGVWKGSMVEHEIGRSLTHTSYSLTLDEKRRATMAVDDSGPLSGTYVVKGDRLLLSLKDEDGEAVDREFRFKVDSATLGLIDPGSGKLLVDLVRQFNQPAAAPPAKAESAKDLADVGDLKFDPEADKALASVEFGAKDGAFRLRHPAGWTAETGGRPDNTYSHITLTKDPYRIAAFADVTGSLISGSDSADMSSIPEGSEFAPVHKAHEHFAKTGTDDLGDYQEGKPEVFKDSSLGEGRISVFTASAGLFGGKLKGYHATVLVRDRRISVLAYGPDQDFARMRPTYLAVCRSLAQ